MNITQFKILSMVVLSVFVAIKSITGQKVLVADYSQGINEFDIQSCKEKPKYLRNHIAPAFLANDIAITPDGTIYANCNNYRTYFLQKVLPYSTDSNPVDSCYFVNESSISTLAGVGGMSITSNERGEILGVNNNFVKYNPKTKSWKNFGAFPDYSDGNDPVYGNFVGSLTRRGDDFYFIGGTHWYDAGPGNNIRGPKKLIKLDTLHPENSTVQHQFDEDILIWELFTIRNSCDEYTTYVVYIVYQKPELRIPIKRALAILDFDTYQLTDLCIDDPNTSQDDFLVGGVADTWTILDSDCIVTVDLDLDNSSGAQGKYDYTDTVGCRYDSIYLSDIDPEVFAKTYIDSLQVFFAGAAPDGTDEYLEVSNPGGLGINWHNPKFVTFINNTNDDFLPLEVAVRSIKYRNLSSTPTYGERKIAFVAYSGKRQSDTAYAFIHLIDDKPNAGRDTLIDLCANDVPVYLDSLLSEDADAQGQWIGTTMQPGIFDPQIDDSGIYRYIAEKDGCKTDTAEIEINVNQLPEFDLGEDTLICQGDMLELTCSIEGADYLWQDGSTTKDYTVQDSGLYVLQVTDDEGCQYTDSIRVGLRQGASTEVHKDTTLCYAQGISWNGIQINTAGEYSYNTANVFGCDSTTILNVAYYPETEVSIQGDTMFCQGDKVTLSAGNYPQYLWNTGDTVSHIQIEKEGEYYLEVTDDNGCTAFDSIYVREIEALQISIDVQDESCYGEKDGSIIVHYISGGIGEKHYYINGSEVTEGNRYNDLSPGEYTVEVEDSLGCNRTEQVRIDSARKLQVSLGEDIIVEDSEKLINLTANNNFDSISNVRWYIDDKEIDNKQLDYQFEPGKDTKVVVVLTNEKGCTQSDTVNIVVSIINEKTIYIPDIFTPDGDGINDTWSIHGSDAIQEIELVGIYDRWGENIYSREHIPVSSSGTALWDGRYKDKPVNPGVYVYFIIFKTHTGKSIRKAGDITVVR